MSLRIHVSHKGSHEWDIASCTADRVVSRALASNPSVVFGAFTCFWSPVTMEKSNK